MHLKAVALAFFVTFALAAGALTSALSPIDMSTSMPVAGATSKVTVYAAPCQRVTITLTIGDVVIHLDPWWNPAVEAQASDRAHRIGQQRPVTIYRLVNAASIEERVLSLHERKQALAEEILSDSAEATRLDPHALLALLAD